MRPPFRCSFRPSSLFVAGFLSSKVPGCEAGVVGQRVAKARHISLSSLPHYASFLHVIASFLHVIASFLHVIASFSSLKLASGGRSSLAGRQASDSIAYAWTPGSLGPDHKPTFSLSSASGAYAPDIEISRPARRN